jgi:hypothetical protein
MRFTDQHVMISAPEARNLTPERGPTTWTWIARDAGGYAVVINSNPPRLLADYREAGPQTRTMTVAVTVTVPARTSMSDVTTRIDAALDDSCDWGTGSWEPPRSRT